MSKMFLNKNYIRKYNPEFVNNLLIRKWNIDLKEFPLILKTMELTKTERIKILNFLSKYNGIVFRESVYKPILLVVYYIPEIKKYNLIISNNEIFISYNTEFNHTYYYISTGYKFVKNKWVKIKNLKLKINDIEKCL